MVLQSTLFTLVLQSTMLGRRRVDLTRLQGLSVLWPRRMIGPLTPSKVLIHAPKDDQVWGIGHKAPEQLLHTTPACPDKTLYIENEGSFSYNERESQNIWLCASRLQDVE